MATLEQYLSAIDYKITNGHEYQWRCFGNARVIESEYQNEKGEYEYTILAAFNIDTLELCTVEAWDYVRDLQYRWVEPAYNDVYREEFRSRNLDENRSIDDRKFIDLDLLEDILDKAQAIVNREDYDMRVVVPLDIGEENEILLMRLAHEADMTLNQYVEKILREEILRRG